MRNLKVLGVGGDQFEFFWGAVRNVEVFGGDEKLETVGEKCDF